MVAAELKNLLLLLKDSLKNKTNVARGYGAGICAHIRYLGLRHSDANNLRRYVESNKPSLGKHAEFTYTGKGTESGRYWWPPMCTGKFWRSVRIKFVEKLISELK